MVNLIPFINRPSIRDKKDFNIHEEFVKMSLGHRIATVLATAIISLVTVFTCTYPYVKMLVGRFRKQELDEASLTTVNTNKIGVNSLSSSKSSTVSALTNPNPDSIKSKGEKPEIEGLKTTFWKDHIVNDKFHLPFQITVINLKDNNEIIAKRCVEQYIEYKRFDDPNFLNDSFLGGLFIKSLAAEIAHNLDQKPDSNSELRSSKKVNQDKISKIKRDETSQVIPERLVIRREVVSSVEVNEAGNDDYDTNPAPPPYLLDANGNYVLNENGERRFADLPPREGHLEQLTVYRTFGEGSCGLHAMLGVVDDNIIKLSDPLIERQSLCVGIRSAPEGSPIRKLVTPILQEYFKVAPQGFKSQILDIYKLYNDKLKFMEDLSRNRQALESYLENLPEDSEIRLLLTPILIEQFNDAQAFERRISTVYESKLAQDFAKEDRVLDAYLTNLEDIHQYLLIEEIHIAALVFDKRVVIYQNLENYMQSEFQPVGYRVFNPSGQEGTVKLWYNGYMHYERIEISSFE